MAKHIDTLAVSFELGADDLSYFRDRLASARAKLENADEAKVISAARGLVDSIAATTAPAFVRVRVGRLKELVDMLEDTVWKLEGEHRARVLNALAYFADPDDMIPDNLPGLGLLDDAIMIDLVCQELAPELEAYADFCDFREARKDADDKLVDFQRDELQRRMRRRGRRGVGAGAGGARTSVLGLW